MVIAENSTELSFLLKVIIFRALLVKAVPGELITYSGKTSKVSLNKEQNSMSKSYQFYPMSISDSSLNYFGSAFGVVISK